MKPLKIVVPDLSTEPVLIRCTHSKLWPPPLVTLDVNIKQMWVGGEISQHDYQQIETWQRVCGVVEMGMKCVGWPLARLEQPRSWHEHHGRKDMVGLHDAIRKAIAKRHKESKLEAGATPAPLTPVEPKAESEAESEAEPESESESEAESTVDEPSTAGEPSAMSFEAEVEEFRDETVKVTEPDYPIPENGNGESSAEEFDDTQGEDNLDDLLDGLGN